jgi:hypothetical protein
MVCLISEVTVVKHYLPQPLRFEVKSCFLPLAALAFSTEPANDWLFSKESGNFQTAVTLELESGGQNTFTLYGALNLEADGAATTNVDLRRHGAAAPWHPANRAGFSSVYPDWSYRFCPLP